ncbi:hypothetical protein GOODEAATRI_022452, partial [Goodea atripinnis]
GLFGQCQAPHQEPVQYRVSVPVLHKLQKILKDLMVQDVNEKNSQVSELCYFFRSSRLLGPGPQRDQDPEGPADSEMMQQYLDYMVLDPSRSSVHMQTPLPYTYHKEEMTCCVCVAEQQFGYQDEEERSLNTLDDNPTFHKGNSLDRDRQLLQDLMSFYLTPSTSSSSSLQSLPRRSLQKLALLLDHYGLNVKDLSPEPKDDLPVALKQPQLDASYIPKKSEGRLNDGVRLLQLLSERIGLSATAIINIRWVRGQQLMT